MIRQRYWQLWITNFEKGFAMNILITGADGFLGGKITRKILEETDYNVLGLTLSMDYVKAMLEREGLQSSDRLQFLTNDEFLCSERTDWDIYGAVHLAFSRRMQPAADIASSIVFASSIFHRLKECGADHVINMSSQGVYGAAEEIRTENTPPAPNTQYTMAKYASEVLFDDILRDCPHHTNFRLDPVAQSQNVLKGLCKSAKEGKIRLKGGKQLFSFIDARDVPGAVVSMLTAQGDWDNVYNVGWNRRRFNLIELGEMVADAAEKCGYPRPEIELAEDDTMLWAGMDSSRFMEKTGWRPTFDLPDTLCTILKS